MVGSMTYEKLTTVPSQTATDVRKMKRPMRGNLSFSWALDKSGRVADSNNLLQLCVGKLEGFRHSPVGDVPVHGVDRTLQGSIVPEGLREALVGK